MQHLEQRYVAEIVMTLNNSHWLAVVLVSILLCSFGILAQNAFAMGPPPGSCSNEYAATIVAFKINNGTQTFDPIANPGVTFEENSHNTYLITEETVHIANQSSQGNTNPGSYWEHSDYYNFQSSSCSSSVSPNQYVNEGPSSIYDAVCGGCLQQVTIYTVRNSVTYNVQWLYAGATSTVPSPPQNLQATGGNAQVSLSWSIPSNIGNSDITGYKIYRSTGSGTETFLATTGNVLSYTDGSVTNSQTYYYKVTALNSAGESPQSNEANATPSAPPTAPQPPTGLKATTVSPSQINLSWTAPGNNGGSAITGYKIERSTDGGTTWNIIVASASHSWYSDYFLSASTTYTYRVSTINAMGTSAPSSTASATTSPATVPDPPRYLTPTVVSPSQINLSWWKPVNSGGSAITGYKIESSTDGGTTWNIIVANTGSALYINHYTNYFLSASTTYTYRISAINAIGTSLPSSTASVTTGPATVPDPPRYLTPTVVSPSQINLSWWKPVNSGGTAITGYQIERSTDGGTTWNTIVANTSSALYINHYY